MRLTNYRKEILGIIQNSDMPLAAKSIALRLESSPNLSTIYRSLDYLEKNKLVKSIFLSENLKFYLDITNHSHFLFCLNCNEIERFDICFADKIKSELEKSFDFDIQDHCLYFTGLCKNCKKK